MREGDGRGDGRGDGGGCGREYTVWDELPSVVPFWIGTTATAAAKDIQSVKIHARRQDCEERPHREAHPHRNHDHVIGSVTIRKRCPERANKQTLHESPNSKPRHAVPVCFGRGERHPWQRLEARIPIVTPLANTPKTRPSKLHHGVEDEYQVDGGGIGVKEVIYDWEETTKHCARTDGRVEKAHTGYNIAQPH